MNHDMHCSLCKKNSLWTKTRGPWWWPLCPL